MLYGYSFPNKREREKYFRPETKKGALCGVKLKLRNLVEVTDFADKHANDYVAFVLIGDDGAEKLVDFGAALACFDTDYAVVGTR